MVYPYPIGHRCTPVPDFERMRFGNRYQLFVILVALLGFNGPICAMACSPDEVSARTPVSSEPHASCHDAEGEGEDERRDASRDERPHRDCNLHCDASALPTANEAPLEPTSISLACLVDASPRESAVLVRALDARPDRWEPPDRRSILLLKSSLQI